MSEQLTVSFGEELKDGYKVADNWVSNGIKWLDDIQNFYRERAAIEKEYASKLQALSAKYFDKKAKISTNLSVGDNPKVTPGSLENASLVTWTEILNQTEQIAKEKQRLGDELTLQVADQVHGVGMRFEDLRKRYSLYNDKMIEDRDKCYSSLKKSKSGYDQACQTMENQRLKSSKSYDRSKDKASRKMEEKEAEMNNAKNNYLIEINVANRLKEKYYHEDVPEMLDGMQQLSEARVAMLNSFWKQSVDLEKSCISRCTDHLTSMVGVIDQNKPSLDSAMFVKHNIAQWNEPADFQYEPSPIWHDDEQMMVTENALQHLRSRLHDNKTKLSDQKALTEQKFEKYTKVLDTKRSVSPSKPQALLEALSAQVNALQELTTNDSTRLNYQVEIETIEVAANGKDLNALPAMEVKKRGLFGRKKTVKVDDPNALSRSETMASVNSQDTSTSTALGAGQHTGSFLSSLVNRSRSKKEPQKTMVRALFTYTAMDDDECTILEGQELVLLAPDDGSGWSNVQNGPKSGLVPASYIETISGDAKDPAEKKKGPAVAPKRGAKKVKYMIALYDYDANGDDELTIRAGDKIVVVSDDSGDGWTEGELNSMSGVFPTAFAKLA